MNLNLSSRISHGSKVFLVRGEIKKIVVCDNCGFFFFFKKKFMEEYGDAMFSFTSYCFLVVAL